MKKLSLKPLKPEALYQKIDPNFFTFETTAEIQVLKEVIGQGRAMDSVQFGIGIKGDGYNLFAMGAPGVGKRAIIRVILDKESKTKPIPSDWCYVFNFEDVQKPIALQLPPGWGNKLKHDIDGLIDDISVSIPLVFEGEEYRARMQKLAEELSTLQENLLKEISEDAKKQRLAIISSPEGFTVLPLDEKGKTIDAESFSKLPEKEQKEKEELMGKFSRRLASFLKQVPLLTRDHRRKEKELRREFSMFAVEHFISDLKATYSDFPRVLDYLNEIMFDVILNVKEFLKREEPTNTTPFSNVDKYNLSRYQVNVLVDNGKTKGAPIIYEENPTYSNLIARVDHLTQFGLLMTNFTLIHAGALHKANGGYLILDARKLLLNPFAWEGLKRALFARKITIEPPEQMIGVLATASLDPEPISIDTKIILYGDRYIYQLLYEYDPDFEELFKVAVDFDDNLDRNEKNLNLFAELIAAELKENTRPFDRSAVAAVIDNGMRIAEDTQKISIHLRSIYNLVNEANYWAGKSGHKIVQASDVQHAIDAQLYRLDRIREEYYEHIKRNIILIQTSGSIIGQVNGLSIVQYGNYFFGHPTRITASVRAGDGRVIDIQREVELSGPIHAKGVLTLSGFLGARYIKDETFSLSASLVFEQTYGFIEGDSASVAELCALLSALANIPINQSLAITGAINQHGEVQAIGGVNEKIEGFFAACQEKGFTGKQGVIIPQSNIEHLLLRDDVIEAVRKKQFFIYPVAHVDEAITLLTGIPAGKRGGHEKFPRGTINYFVEKSLIEFAKIKKPAKKKNNKKKKR